MKLLHSTKKIAEMNRLYARQTLNRGKGGSLPQVKDKQGEGWF